MSEAWDLSDDPWIAGTTIADPRLLHALGCLSLAWNDCESKLMALFSQVSGVQLGAFRQIAGDMTANQLHDRFRGWIGAAVKVAQPDDFMLHPDERDLLKNLLKVFSVCRNNRNRLFHATPLVDREGVPRLYVVKAAFIEVPELEVDFEDVRRVVSEVWELSRTMHFTTAYFASGPDMQRPYWTLLPWLPLPRAL